MNGILHSAEVRWFFRGEVPEPPGNVLAWFRADKNLPWPPPSRVDRYLILPGYESAGVKLREGKFEVKVIRGAIESVRYPYGVSGRADAWAKWSYDGAAVDPLIAALRRENSGWIDITKWRLLRKFSLDQTNPIEVEEQEQPEQGCNVELTAVQANESYWWTLGLEAYGPAEAVRGLLHRGASHFFAQNPPPVPLNTTQSCAYPTWLNSVAG